MKKSLSVLPLILIIVLTGCSSLGIGPESESQGELLAQRTGPGMMGPGSGMMNRHHGQVPEEFTGLTNPIAADDASLDRGAVIYAAQCATCHGDFGNGDGPGGTTLDPAPAAIAHTSQMMSDAYLFWRITEGGIPFETGMIPYRDILDEDARWDVINYVRALGRGQVHPSGPKIGGQPFDPAQEQAQRTEMLSQAVEESVISQAEGVAFDQVHSLMDKYLAAEGASGMDTGPRADALPQILAAMVAADIITQDQTDAFLDVHDRLIEAGLMQ